MEAQLADHLPGTNTEKPTKLIDYEILKMNEKYKKKKKNYLKKP